MYLIIPIHRVPPPLPGVGQTSMKVVILQFLRPRSIRVTGKRIAELIARMIPAGPGFSTAVQKCVTATVFSGHGNSSWIFLMRILYSRSPIHVLI